MDDADATDRDELLERLGRLAARLDPVPEHVRAAARAALTWRTVDAELATLLHDSAESPELAGVRSADTARVLAFGAGDLQLELDLEVAGDDAERLVIGQLVPPAAGRVEIRHTGGATAVEADERGRFTAAGIPRGAVSLRVARRTDGGERVVVTPWLPI